MTERAGGSNVRVATLNVRNTADRWRARRGLLVDQLVELTPDLIGLQELRRLPDQGRWIIEEAAVRSGGRLRLARWPAWKSGLGGWWEGIAVLSRLPVTHHEVLPLEGQSRVAQRVTVTLDGGGAELDFYNTHLSSRDRVMREQQSRRLLDWMARRPSRPQVLVGDFNSRPDSPAIGEICGRLRSACAVANGAEPGWTVPTPLRKANPGLRKVVDYVFVNDLVEVLDARVVFDRPDGRDPGLMASDHLGLAATLSIRSPGG